MRRRIQRLAAGKFEQEQPVLSLSEEKIEIEVLEGQDYTGEFVIEVSNHVPVKGLIYSSNPYMECLTPEFEGKKSESDFSSIVRVSGLAIYKGVNSVLFVISWNTAFLLLCP